MTENRPNDDGPSQDEALAALVAAGRSLASAARASGCSVRTAQRRMADPGFRKRVGELRAAMVARAVGRLSAAMGAAANRLRVLLRSEDEKVALAAARAILEAGPRLLEHEELAARVAELEASLRAPKR